MEIPISNLGVGKEARVIRLDGGHGFQRKLGIMGIREGKTIKLVARHPLNGPVVVEVDGRETTIGSGMAHRIIVEVQ